ncbi:hypothetical protein RchiOBHm_Chr4g0431351 [Rosa chinensis]|uniref:Uncharacterized protein n=1 Tax=Rosa chinensis TaxID=74649 RepID=A0A2P6R0P0_ROSCH|nr:hypothetical protein RchiOBHm_Chr4g0431351 [Rosa chinensis]
MHISESKCPDELAINSEFGIELTFKHNLVTHSTGILAIINELSQLICTLHPHSIDSKSP